MTKMNTYNYTITVEPRESGDVFVLTEADSPFAPGTGEYQSMDAAIEAVNKLAGRILNYETTPADDTDYEFHVVEGFNANAYRKQELGE